MAQHISELDYTFAIGRIKALERFLIKEAVFQEAINADLDSALRLFVESGLFDEELLRVKDSVQLEQALEKESAGLKKLIAELVLDKGLLKLLDLSTAEKLREALINCGSRFLKNYLMHLADMHNIKTFLRLRILEEPLEALVRHLSFEGFIKKDAFAQAYVLELGAFMHLLEYVYNGSRMIDYAYFLRGAIEKAKQEKSFVVLEKAINDFLVGALRPVKYFNLGPEPVLAYYFAKDNEIKLMRMIILAKLNALPAKLLQERLNSVYA
ncbi:MAG: hypothetical protein FJZ08_00250 [Candidatus Omnitrophica bacterium]|nr:hypothetical protein [Candidatus Omnitrophota bacterium]